MEGTYYTKQPNVHFRKEASEAKEGYLAGEETDKRKGKERTEVLELALISFVSSTILSSGVPFPEPQFPCV